tara:strand:+ start:2036 stop:3463 length:1428 start_codon:yes stop_codon:yes gene_type:complete
MVWRSPPRIVLLLVLVLLSHAVAAENSVHAVLESWVNHRGGDIRRVGIAADPRRPGQTVLAMRANVNAGDLVLTIPFALSLTSDWAADPLLRRVPAKDTALVPAFWRLALRLLHHQRVWGKAPLDQQPSPYRAYIATLPSEHGLPFSWHAKELSFLAGTSAHRAIAAQRAQLETDIAEIIMPLAALHPTFAFPRSALEWAAGIVWSRCYSHSDSEGGTTFSLVPILDAANHRPRPVPAADRVRYVLRDEEKGARFVYAAQALAPGDEYEHDYGALSNEQLFAHFGFVAQETNPDDSVTIQLDLVAAGCCSEEVRGLLLRAGAIDSEGSMLAAFPLFLNGLSPGLIAAHRLAFLQGKDELALASRALSGQPVSAANEARVRAALTAACEEVLATLPWKRGSAKRMSALEVQGAERTPAESRRLVMLRLIFHTRELLRRNVKLFAAYHDEALRILREGGGGAEKDRATRHVPSREEL